MRIVTLLALVLLVAVTNAQPDLNLVDCQPAFQTNYSNFYACTYNEMVGISTPSNQGDPYALFLLNNSLFPYTNRSTLIAATSVAWTDLTTYYMPGITVPSGNDQTFQGFIATRWYRINQYGSIQTLNGVPFKNLSVCPFDPTSFYVGTIYELSGFHQYFPSINSLSLNRSIASGLLANASILLNPANINSPVVNTNITRFANITRITPLNVILSSSRSVPYTVFVPMDSANWSNPISNATYFGLSHVVSSTFFKAAFQAKTTVLTNLNGEPLIVRNDFNNGTFTIGYSGRQATILPRSDCYTDNGVIHTISAPLYPQSIDPTIPASIQSVLNDGLTCGGSGYDLTFLAEQLLTAPSGFKTIFAFSDAAYIPLSADVATFDPLLFFSSHTLAAQVPSDLITASTTQATPRAGPYLRFNYDSNNNLIVGGQAKVICPDQWTRDGIIHLIDRPIFPLSAENNLTIAAYLSSDNSFSTLRTAISGLFPTLNLMDPTFTEQYTIFAPTNAAFTSLPSSILANIQANPALATRIFAYHLSPKLLFPLLYPTSTAVPSLSSASGDVLTVMSNAGSIFNLTVNGAVTLGPLSQRRNGIHYTTNNVLIPPPLLTSAVVTQMSTIPSLSTFVAWIKSFPSTSPVTLLLSNSLNLEKFTLFAPLNSAFTDLGLNESNVISMNDAAGEALFFRHMVAKDLPASQLVNDLIVQSFVEGQTFNSSSGIQWLRFNRAAASPNDWYINGKTKITGPDAATAAGSYVHTIDSVLSFITPEQNTTVGFSLAIPGNSVGLPTLFKSRTGGVAFGAQLDNAVLGSTPFTVFAFDNATFAAEFTNKTQTALDASPSMFQALIRNHIINFSYFSTTINTATVRTLAGNSYVVRVLPGGVLSFDGGRINATIRAADVIRRNGVAHVIDKVLWPVEVKAYVSSYGNPSPTPTPTPTPTTPRTPTPTPPRPTPTPTPFDPNATPTPTPTPTEEEPTRTPTPTPSSAYDTVAVPALLLSALFLVAHAFF